ncbi:MAG: tRNA (adenosine(37)-N6)-dimethylallyltransferase MiaA [Rikenellaceae bacterium]|nr:tRNA (adenosine(37)-N6)-dimethylallyltransferase MiaA [Rikenellaceae bacterium]MCL2691982.1 tRNA (adenosine(37)-N6)-dimethylallyltransferase MiaA [Rikenellaceae bacterium]
MKRTLVVIVGPTGSGKTGLSVEVARHFGAPIVSADSRQFYRGMAIGTAQPVPEQLSAVPHHFIASREITDEYSCGRYETDALALLDELFRTHQVVVAVGGSGLYVDALCHGMDTLPDADLLLRAQLSARSLDELLTELERLDPECFAKIDHQNPQRIIRALEVCLQTGRPYSEFRTGRTHARTFRIIKVGTHLPREELYARIDRRVDEMIAAGLEAEARALYPHRALNSLQTVGYRELFDYFDGHTTRYEAIGFIKRNSRRYAKRQVTWFGRDARIAWFDPADTVGVTGYIEEQLARK